jgi:hypothetical protein
MVGLSYKPEEVVMESVLLDAAGRRRSPATMPGFHSGRPPRNKGLRYPPDPPSVEEIVVVMRTVGVRGEGVRLRALIVILWRAGCGSQKRSLWPRAILTRFAVRFWFAAGRAGGGVRWGWIGGALSR